MGCLAAYFTHVQPVFKVLRSGLLPYKLHIRTSCSTVEGYLPVTSRHVRTSHAGATVDKERHVTSRHVTSGRHRRRRGQGGRHVTSRHVRASQRSRGQGGRHVTSRQDITGAAVDKKAVTSRHVRTSQAPAWTRRPSRHVTSRHDVRRPQSGPCSHLLSQGGPQLTYWTKKSVKRRQADSSLQLGC